MAELISLDFVRATKRSAASVASLKECLGKVLAAQRNLAGRQKELLQLMSHVELDIPVQFLRDGVPVNLVDLAPETRRSTLRQSLATDLYDVAVKQWKLRIYRGSLRQCLRMAAKGEIEKVNEILDSANAAADGGEAWQAWTERQRARRARKGGAREVETAARAKKDGTP